MLRIILSGACGRMGHEVTQALTPTLHRIVAGVDVCPADASPFPVYPSFSMIVEEADVLVDFSRPEALLPLLDFAVARRLPVVLAATGYNEADLAAVSRAALRIPVFQSANMSIGVYALRRLAEQAKALLPGFDIEIVEKHHNQKLDAPSGTAMMLYHAVKNADSVPVYGRCTRTEKREPTEIGLHAVRGGTLAGEHEIGFYGNGETLLITHSAQGRAIFADGALRAASFIVAQSPGLYSMDDLAAALAASK